MKACNKVYSRIIFGLMMLCFCGVFFAQNTESATTTNNEKEISLRYSFTGTYVLVERSNWSKYINGKYVGLTSRESRGYLKSGEKTQKMFLQRNCEEKECREEAKLLLLQGRAPQSAAEDRGRQCVLFPETFLERGKRNHLRD